MHDIQRARARPFSIPLCPRGYNSKDGKGHPAHGRHGGVEGNLTRRILAGNAAWSAAPTPRAYQGGLKTNRWPEAQGTVLDRTIPGSRDWE